MAQPLDIPLPELTTDDFKRGWTRFELVVPIFMSISDSRTFCVADYINVELYLVYCTCICN